MKKLFKRRARKPVIVDEWAIFKDALYHDQIEQAATPRYRRPCPPPPPSLLKPCPFCGGKAVIDKQMGRFYINPIHSENCEMRTSTWLLSSRPLEEQINAWNRRSKT